MMIHIDPKEVQSDVEQALERQEHEGGRQSIFDILKLVAPSSCDYWYEVACELHRRGKIYESLECWHQAEKYLPSSRKEPYDWYLDMARTLMNASAQSGDSFLYQKALDACNKLIALNADEEALNLKLELIQEMNCSRKEVFSLVEEILDRDFCITSTIDRKVTGENAFDRLEDYFDLARYYLWLDQPSDAFRVWSKLIEKKKTEATPILRDAIYTLVLYANSKGLDLPELFDLLT